MTGSRPREHIAHSQLRTKCFFATLTSCNFRQLRIRNGLDVFDAQDNGLWSLHRDKNWGSAGHRFRFRLAAL